MMIDNELWRGDRGLSSVPTLVQTAEVRRWTVALVSHPFEQTRFGGKAPLGLVDIVVARHAAIDDALATEGRGLADDGEVDLAEVAQDHTDFTRQDPDVVGT